MSFLFYEYIGGLWYYMEELMDGQFCVMKFIVINISKEMMCYSDYFILKEYLNFMYNKYVFQYFNLYVEKFDFKKYIWFKIEVIFVL